MGYSRGYSRILKYSKYISLALLIFAVVFGCYLRLMPLINAINEGIVDRYPEARLYELDPYAMYWVTKYLVKNGLTSWWHLTRDNSVTHIFWHPWGRDFTHTELPGLAFFAAATYHIVKLFNVDLLTWMSLIPVLSAALSIIGVYLLCKEITNSKAAAVASALLLSLVFVDRSIAGFTVKYLSLIHI